MTHQEKLAFIRAKCIEANEGIKALEFGCKATWKKPKNEHEATENVPAIVLTNYRNGTLEIYSRFSNHKLWMTMGVFASDLTDVIGRPIRLADVLIIVCYGANKAITDTQILGAISYWDLRKDDLNEQDEATINFIHSIIL